jgi:hypothetical protein
MYSHYIAYKYTYIDRRREEGELIETKQYHAVP